MHLGYLKDVVNREARGPKASFSSVGADFQVSLEYTIIMCHISSAPPPPPPPPPFEKVIYTPVSHSNFVWGLSLLSMPTQYILIFCSQGQLLCMPWPWRQGQTTNIPHGVGVKVGSTIGCLNRPLSAACKAKLIITLHAFVAHTANCSHLALAKMYQPL